DLLTYLVTIFVNNGFGDIGTFLLPEVTAETQFELNGDSYQYRDSNTALQDLLSDSNVRSKEALRRLLTAARQYFDLAAAIPGAYATALAIFDSSDQLQINSTIRLLGRDQESVINLSAILASSQLRQMQRILGVLGEHINSENDSFLNDLDDL